MENMLKHLISVLSYYLYETFWNFIDTATIIIIILVKLGINLKMYIFSKKKFKYSGLFAV